MKRIGIIQKTRLIVQNVWLLCSALSLILVYWIAIFLSRSLIAISCLTLQCAQGVNALSKKTAGVIWRLLTDTKVNLQLRHLQTKAANTSGT